MKKLVHFLLVAVFFYVYIRMFIFMNISLNSSEAILVGSLIVLLISFILALITADSIVRILKQ
ncbi:hypothetical protein [Tindallia californiensis]|uniref:hypothetical protein n=1 Tax=Tindallia californiensis TaxID=159292 RepID=UPI000B804E17|nr:hypothetical protein [Tindallia californiensis]